ncbi:MAG: NAD-dependent epimerase [Pseudomonadota bacterium]
MSPILVTGAAGFIGFHTSRSLLARGETVIGLDSVNDYYDVSLKEARLAQLSREERFEFVRADLSSKEKINSVFESHRPDRVINLAAQAGVRYAFDNPHAYVDSNLMGFLNILEGCRHYDVKHLVYASSSSVYGANTSLPFSVDDNVDHPVSFYAVTKKANELMAHSYAHLYGIPTTGLRFFTVYGPWGRPDMAMFIFTKKILAGEPIDVFNNGQHSRDFTYIDDIVDGIVRSLDHVAEGDAKWSGDTPNPATSNAPYRLFNIGNHQAVELMHLISCIEDALGRKAEKNFLPMQPGDVPRTFANIDALTEATGFAPTTPIEEGVKKFIDWYLSYYEKGAA